jgi:hypothetical protein
MLCVRAVYASLDGGKTNAPAISLVIQIQNDVTGAFVTRHLEFGFIWEGFPAREWAERMVALYRDQEDGCASSGGIYNCR